MWHGVELLEMLISSAVWHILSKFFFRPGPTCNTGTALARVGWRRFTMAGVSFERVWLLSGVLARPAPYLTVYRGLDNVD
jgi:hypothetical protein